MTKKRKILHHADLERVRLPRIWVRPKVARPLTLPESAAHMVATLEDAISTGAVRLPIPGFLEAIVDLKRALKT